LGQPKNGWPFFFQRASFFIAGKERIDRYSVSD
jgi:hypothetical protein